MEKELLIEVACEAYCKCCDTKDCEDLGEFNDFNCDWVCKFRKEFTKELNKKSKTKTMETEKVKQIERQLERRGYKLYTRNLVGNEDYAYMKTTRNADGELKYIISHGFYDWRDEVGVLEDYGYSITIVLGNTDERVDVTLTQPKFIVEECEEIAEKLSEFFKPYFEKYKVRNI